MALALEAWAWIALVWNVQLPRLTTTMPSFTSSGSRSGLHASIGSARTSLPVVRQEGIRGIAKAFVTGSVPLSGEGEKDGFGASKSNAKMASISRLQDALSASVSDVSVHPGKKRSPIFPRTAAMILLGPIESKSIKATSTTFLASASMTDRHRPFSWNMIVLGGIICRLWLVMSSSKTSRTMRQSAVLVCSS